MTEVLERGSLYSQDMLESISKIEATRDYRMTEDLPTLTIDERLVLLKKSHPDFNLGSLRELRVGPNKGEKIYNEFADKQAEFS